MGDLHLVITRRLATQDLRDATAHYAGEVDAGTARRFIDAVEQVLRILHARRDIPTSLQDPAVGT